MDRGAKAALIQSLNEKLSKAELVVVTRQIGLTSGETSKLRRSVRDSGAGFKVAKNRLARLALKGTKYEALSEHLKGPTGLAMASDPVAAAKALVKFAKENDKLTILAGAFGDQLMDVKQLETLSKLPGLNELRAKLIGLLQAPATKVAGVVQAPAGQLARVFAAYARKGEAA